ncbi:MAG: diguanylate cyclase [Planctomycetota bacterium]
MAKKRPKQERATEAPAPTAPAIGEGEAPPAEGPAEPDTSAILEERGEVEQSLIEIAARDMDRTAEDEKALARERERKPGSFYSDLLYTLANIRYPEDEARLVWVNLLTHKAEMSQLLGRNVGIRVAALDFFRNVLGNLGDVKIVDSSEYIETAKLAVTDGLTGIHNHRYFQDSLARSIEQAARERVPVSLLMVDIDHFKQYNDRYGHIAGDVALREVAAALKDALPGGAVVSRYGGEEFAAILYAKGKPKALEEAEHARERVEALALAGPGETDGSKLTISLGVATSPEDASDRNGLIDWADLSLYLAKTGGRNRVVSCPVDRRRVERYHADLDVRLRARDARQEAFRRFAVVDIGVGGVALVGERLPASGSPVAVLIAGGGLKEPLAMEGRVAWRRAESRLGELAGVEFVSLSAASARTLARWLVNLKGA